MKNLIVFLLAIMLITALMSGCEERKKDGESSIGEECGNNIEDNFFDGKLVEEGCWFGLDDETMTLTGASERSLLHVLLNEFDRGTLSAEIIYNDQVIATTEDLHNGQVSGDLQEGMLLRIFSDGELYAEYTVGELRKAPVFSSSN